MSNRRNTNPLQTFFEFASKQYFPCYPIIRRETKKVTFWGEKLKINFFEFFVALHEIIYNFAFLFVKLKKNERSK